MKDEFATAKADPRLVGIWQSEKKRQLQDPGQDSAARSGQAEAQRRFLLSSMARRALTSFLMREEGRGWLTGNWMVPLEISYDLRSFLQEAMTAAVGKRLQCLAKAANQTSVALYLKAGMP